MKKHNLGLVPRKRDEVNDPFVPEGLAGMAKWAAGGFTVLTGAFAILGIEKGGLLSLVATKPYPALYVFGLMGLGVLGALLAMAVGRSARVSVSVPILVALLLGIGLVLLLPDMKPDVEDEFAAKVAAGLTLVAIAAAAALFVWLLGRKIAVSAALVFLATAAISMGLYGGVKLAVHARMTDNGAAVSATLGTGAQPSLKLHVRAALPPKVKTLDIKVLLKKPGAEATLLRAKLTSDRAGELDETIDMPVPVHKEWTEVVVRRCNDNKCDDDGSPVMMQFNELSPPPAKIEQG